MADHLGDVADSVGPVGGRVTQVRHAAASAQRIVACMTNEHFWCDEFLNLVTLTTRDYLRPCTTSWRRQRRPCSCASAAAALPRCEP